jgi:hypothetical protein
VTFQILVAVANVDVRVRFRDCDGDGSKHVGNVSHKALIFETICCLMTIVVIKP